MAEPTIQCPKCGTEFPLTASLAAPLVEATRRDFEARLAAKDAETAQREAGYQEREAALAQAREALDAQVNVRVAAERAKIASEEAAKAKILLDNELAEKHSEISGLQDLLKQRNEKVAELQKAQTELARQRQELEDARNELDVTVAEKLRDERDKVAAEAEKKARLALQDDIDPRTRRIGGGAGAL